MSKNRLSLVALAGAAALFSGYLYLQPASAAPAGGVSQSTAAPQTLASVRAHRWAGREGFTKVAMMEKPGQYVPVLNEADADGLQQPAVRIEDKTVDPKVAALATDLNAALIRMFCLEDGTALRKFNIGSTGGLHINSSDKCSFADDSVLSIETSPNYNWNAINVDASSIEVYDLSQHRNDPAFKERIHFTAESAPETSEALKNGTSYLIYTYCVAHELGARNLCELHFAIVADGQMINLETVDSNRMSI